MYCSLQYITFTSCNVVVLCRIILHCNDGWHIKDGVILKEDVTMVSNTRICSFPKMAMRFLCLVSCCSSLLYHCSQHGLYEVMAAITLCFCFCFVAVFFLHWRHNFCNFYVVTMRPLAPLQQQMINLHKHTQLFVTGYFNFIRKRDECLHTSHTFSCNPKEGKSWDHTPQPRTRTAKLVASH